jgi:signal transduction histidine kinase
MKYTPSGGSIRVDVSREGDHARVDVSDTGIGIPAAAIPHIFERFYRADPARSSAGQSAGLGLSLVKWIVDRHHGHIDVRTAPGSGSTFTTRLPIGAPAPADKQINSQLMSASRSPHASASH